MIVMHVVGWWEDWQEMVWACPHLRGMVDAYGYYCSRYEDRVWGLELLGEWGGYQGVYRVLEEWPERIAFLGREMVCDGLAVDVMVVTGDSSADARCMYVLGGRYARRVGKDLISIGGASL